MVIALLAVIMVVSGPIEFVEALVSHEEPGGRARVHHPTLGQTCFRTGCVNDRPTVEFALRDGGSDEVEDRELYDRARREGPFFVQVRWLSSSHSVTQVEEDGRWRLVAHAAAGNAVEGVLVLVIGVILLFAAAGVWPGDDGDERAEAAPTEAPAPQV